MIADALQRLRELPRRLTDIADTSAANNPTSDETIVGVRLAIREVASDLDAALAALRTERGEEELMATPEGLCTKCSATQYCTEHDPKSRTERGAQETEDGARLTHLRVKHCHAQEHVSAVCELGTRCCPIRHFAERGAQEPSPINDRIIPLLFTRDIIDGSYQEVERSTLEEWFPSVNDVATQDSLVDAVGFLERLLVYSFDRESPWVRREAHRILEALRAARAPQEPPALNVKELRESCHMTYNGGWHGNPDALRAFHHGMDTVCNVLEASGPLFQGQAQEARAAQPLDWQPITDALDADQEVLMWTPRERIYTTEQLTAFPDLPAGEQRVSTRRMWTWATHYRPLPSPPAAQSVKE